MEKFDILPRCITPLMKQCWVVSPCFLAMVCMGMSLGLSSSLLPALQAPDSSIKMSLEISSWYVASGPIASLIAYFLSSYLMNIYGRRTAFALDLIPGIAGMTLTCYASDVYSLISGKLLDGFTAGACSVLGAVVIGEYTNPEYRPTFLNLKTAALYIGSLIVHILGNFLHWRTVAMIIVVIYVISLVMVYTWPESPSWLAQKNKLKKSKETFFWLRGKSEDSIREITELVHAQKENKTQKNFCESIVEVLRIFTKKNFLKPAIIFFFAAILLETSGRHIFPAYAKQIMSEILGHTRDSFYQTLAMDLIIASSAIFSSYLVKVMKLRTVLFLSGSAAFLMLMISCLYLFLSSRGFISGENSLIPLSLFAIYFVLVNFGCAPTPLALVGEIFPLEYRAVGASYCGYVLALCATIALKLMSYMLSYLKIYGAFTVLGICMAMSLIVLYFMLPETKHRTLQEIENYFNHGTFRDDNEINHYDDEVSDEEIIKGTENSRLRIV